jgi:hypothetical protein
MAYNMKIRYIKNDGCMRRSTLCVSVALLLCLVVVPKPAAAQIDVRVVKENVVMTRASYPAVKPSEGLVRAYVGDWQLAVSAYNYGTEYEYNVSCKIFVDNALMGTSTFGWWSYWGQYWVDGISQETAETVNQAISIPRSGNHEIRIEIWHGTTETQPCDTYSFNVTAVEPEVSNLQASSRVVRALGDNSLAVSFTNGGNENMHQAVLSVADSNGLTVTPSSVELGDVNPSEQVSASFTVTSPASVTLGTAQVRFSLSFIDYAGISHTEDVLGTVEVYRLSPTLTVSAPSSVENGSTVEIAATLKDPGGNPIANENITLTIGGVSIGTFKTGSGGAARASYRATETGTLNVGASFSGSASYDATSTSGEFTVTPATAFPYWVILLIALPMALAAVLMIWRRRRREVQPVRKVRR